MPVGEMLLRMSSAELTEWMAYYDLRANPPKPQQTTADVRTTLDAMVARGASGGFARRTSR